MVLVWQQHAVYTIASEAFSLTSLEPSRGSPGDPVGPLGFLVGLLEALLRGLGALLGLLAGVSEASWGPVGLHRLKRGGRNPSSHRQLKHMSWGFVWPLLERSWALLGPSWAPLGPLLGLFWAVLGPL